MKQRLFQISLSVQKVQYKKPFKWEASAHGENMRDAARKVLEHKKSFTTSAYRSEIYRGILDSLTEDISSLEGVLSEKGPYIRFTCEEIEMKKKSILPTPNIQPSENPADVGLLKLIENAFATPEDASRMGKVGDTINLPLGAQNYERFMAGFIRVPKQPAIPDEPADIGILRMQAFEKKKSDVPDEKLIERAEEWITKLCQTGGRAWTLQVPPSVGDPDMVFSELIKRFSEKNGGASDKGSQSQLIDELYDAAIKSI